ncbi:fimbria/pilus outer membrane usher protein [Burkholderia cenocepacia]|uniref:fimbria/pilus outer membrane usher protein n=1 Tax=Burkholderia cenocepacia TaxID=95486 RepID=UPI002AC35C5F|nr:fimbria/pilus outer membrane usher protein [Burkholderia cenocepacia]
MDVKCRYIYGYSRSNRVVMRKLSATALLACVAMRAYAYPSNVPVTESRLSSERFFNGTVMGNPDISSNPTKSGSIEPPRAVEFNSQFFSGTAAADIDISRFGKGNTALPGHYRAALYVNGAWIGETNIDLAEVEGEAGDVQPMFDRDLLTRAGVDLNRLPEAARQKIDTSHGGNGVALLTDLIPDATASFDIGEQRLEITVPQAMMRQVARGWVDPEFWDDGETAGTLEYNSNLYHTTGIGRHNTAGYLALRAGLNVGAWRFRYNGDVTTQTGSGVHVQTMQTYVQRSIASIKSKLTIGDLYTDGMIFDSFGMRGVLIATEDRMYPESLRGYAPIVHGIANTNARVQIKQNGNIIYEITVPPGPFEINDLYPTGYGGDLRVIVTEADGRQSVSSVPYSAPVNALRPGRWRYSVVAGRYRNPSANYHPYVFEVAAQHGITNLVTIYGGMIASRNYVSGAVGVALNTAIGGFAADVTRASAHGARGENRGGQSLRLSYSHMFEPTDTDVTLAAYRYSTSGYLSLADAMMLRELAMEGIGDRQLTTEKQRLQLTLNQTLGKWGSIYASGYIRNYWNRTGHDASFQVGYNTNIQRIGLGLSVAREYERGRSRWNNRIMLNLNIPLGIGQAIANTSTAYMYDSLSKADQIQESFTGATSGTRQINYGVTAGYTSGGAGASLSANAGYLAPATQARLDAGYGHGYTQVGGGLSGTVVAYRGGVVLSSQTGDTLAVIEAKDAVGAGVSTAAGVVVDSHGHAVISGMAPYTLNSAEIDTKGLPMGVELKSTEQRFAPTAGAVVRVKFETDYRGDAVLMNLRRPNGDVVPFGADVLDADGNSIGTVSQGSRALFYSKRAANDLTVKWGEGADQICKVRYDMPAANNAKSKATTFADSICE